MEILEKEFPTPVRIGMARALQDRRPRNGRRRRAMRIRRREDATTTLPLGSP